MGTSITAPLRAPVLQNDGTPTRTWSLFFAGLASAASAAPGYVTVTTTQFGAKSDGITDDTRAIEAAFKFLAPTGGNLLFPGGFSLIGHNVSTPDNVALAFNVGAGIAVGAGATLTINGPIIAPPQPIFSGLVQFGPGAFAGGQLAGIPVEWFGGGVLIADNTAAIQAAINALATVGGGVQAASWAAGAITIQTKGLHRLTTGQLISTASAAPAGYNVAELAVTVIDETHFSVAVAVDPGAYVAGGIVTLLYPGGNTDSNTPYPPVVFGAGSYVWTGTVDMPNYQYVCLAGTGIDSTFLVHSPAGANTDGIKWRSADGQYKRSNGLRDMTVYSTTGNTRYLTFASEQLRFQGLRVKFDTSTSTPAQYLTRLSGLDTCVFYDCQWYFAGVDNILFNRDGGGDVSTSTQFVGCNSESATNAGINLSAAVSILWMGGVLQANKYAVKIGGASQLFLKGAHVEGNLTSAIFCDDSTSLSFVQSTGNRYSGSGGTDILIDIDACVFKGSTDHAGGVYQMYRTTANSTVYQFGDPANYLNGSGATVFNSGDGQFLLRCYPLDADWTSDQGNKTGTWELRLHHGGFQLATLTGDTAIDIGAGEGNTGWVPGTRLRITLLQDATGGRVVTWGSSVYTVVAPLTTVGNVAGARCFIELELDKAGTTWNLIRYVPWFTAANGYFNSPAMQFSGTMEIDGNSVTIGAALDSSVGFKYAGIPPPVDFINPTAIDRLGEFYVPHGPATTGVFTGRFTRVAIDSGTQAYAIGHLFSRANGTVTNETIIRIGAKSAIAGNWSIYDDSQLPWYQDAGGVVIGPATGGSKGNGTINVSAGIYLNNSAFTNPDYVFEKYWTGRIQKFAGNPGASKYRMLPLSRLKAYTKRHHRLPGVHQTAEIGARLDVLLRYVEELHLRAYEQDERTSALERQTKRKL